LRGALPGAAAGGGAPGAGRAAGADPPRPPGEGRLVVGLPVLRLPPAVRDGVRADDARAVPGVAEVLTLPRVGWCQHCRETQGPIVDGLVFNGLGLIIRWPSGVRYTSQVAGHACEHPMVEGVFVPLFDDLGRPALHALRQHFRGTWHPLKVEDANIVDG